MKKQEKRGAPRVPYVSEVVCDGAGTRLIARTSDLSVSGVFIHSKLCCDAGSLLHLRFDVTSTQIETVGEVCYSIPQVGMGVRFLNLNPEFQTVISNLIDSQEPAAESPVLHSRRITSSGVEAVDELLGGLERGSLYLAHGDTAGKSLFGIQFLIRGLRNGQRGALITSSLRVDAVRRFASLGYDCLGDIRRGSLVLFRSSADLSERVLELGRLEPLLRDLEPVMGKASPERIVFDPVNNLLAGRSQEDMIARANELSVWLRSFNATVVLVASSNHRGVIDSLAPTVKESFRFGVKESNDRIVRFMAFEKSAHIPDQAVRVDPSRGISLLKNASTGELLADEAALRADNLSDLKSSQVEEVPATLVSTSDTDAFVATDEAGNPLNLDDSAFLFASEGTGHPAKTDASEEACDEFFAMLDELQSFASSPDPDEAETQTGKMRPLSPQRADQGTPALEPHRLD